MFLMSRVMCHSTLVLLQNLRTVRVCVLACVRGHVRACICMSGRWVAARRVLGVRAACASAGARMHTLPCALRVRTRARAPEILRPFVDALRYVQRHEVRAKAFAKAFAIGAGRSRRIGERLHYT